MASESASTNGNRLNKVSHIHECIILEMCNNPTITQLELAEKFGYSPNWMSRMLSSDSFKARLAYRREEMLAPELRARLNMQVKTTVLQGIDVLQKKLNSPEASAETALQALMLSSTALGMARPKTGNQK